MTQTKLETVAKERTALATRPLDIEAVLMKAAESNMALEGVRQLMIMRQELRAEAALEAFNAALALFQSKCPVIAKTTKVTNTKGEQRGQVRYSYAKLEFIISKVRTLMKQCGFSYTFKARISERGAVEIVCILKHVAGHSEESPFEIPIDAQAYMNEPQRFGSASTFAKRYAFCNALGILTGDDDDANSLGDPEAKKSTITQPRSRSEAAAASTNARQGGARPPAQPANGGGRAPVQDERHTPPGDKISQTQANNILERMEEKALSSGDLFKRFNVMRVGDLRTSQVRDVYAWINNPTAA